MYFVTNSLQMSIFPHLPTFPTQNFDFSKYSQILTGYLEERNFNLYFCAQKTKKSLRLEEVADFQMNSNENLYSIIFY